MPQVPTTAEAREKPNPPAAPASITELVLGYLDQILRALEELQDNAESPGGSGTIGNAATVDGPAAGFALVSVPAPGGGRYRIGVRTRKSGASAKLITSANPAAGVEASIIVPPGEVWEVETIHTRLDTSVAVANREVAILIDDGVTEFLAIPTALTLTASLAQLYFWAAELGAGFSPTQHSRRTFSLPRLVLQPGWRIRTSTANLQAGDDFTPLVVTARVLPSGVDKSANARLWVGRGPVSELLTLPSSEEHEFPDVFLRPGEEVSVRAIAADADFDYSAFLTLTRVA